MPDLTFESMQQCTNYLRGCQSDKWRGNGGCWPFKRNGSCKHMCTWHEIVGDVTQTEEQADKMVCPVCGEETEWVRVGV